MNAYTIVTRSLRWHVLDATGVLVASFSHLVDAQRAFPEAAVVIKNRKKGA